VIASDIDPDTFMALMKALVGAGWQVIEYKDHREGLTLTIVRQEKKET